jgi:hypothetical protein
MHKQSTIYPAKDGQEPTTISIDKNDADVLQKHIFDVHKYIQDLFDRVKRRYPELTRRKQGDLVRRLAQNEAWKYPESDIHLIWGHGERGRRRYGTGVNFDLATIFQVDCKLLRKTILRCPPNSGRAGGFRTEKRSVSF